MVDNLSLSVIASVVSLLFVGSVVAAGAAVPGQLAGADTLETTERLQDPTGSGLGIQQVEGENETEVDNETDAEVDPQDIAYLRVMHASPDAPAVDVYLNNESVLTNVSFTDASEYQPLAAGTYNLTITVADDRDAVLFENELDLEPRIAVTVYAAGEVSENTTTTFQPVGFIDDPIEPAEDQSAVSFVHLSPDAPTVDVTANNGSVVIADDVTYQNASDYVTVPAGDHTLEIRSESPTNDGAIVATVDVELEEESAYTATAVGYATLEDAPADTPLEVVLSEDVTITFSLPEGQE